MKKILTVMLSFFLLSCNDSNKTKLTTYCMNTFNVYAEVSKDSCSCLADFLEAKLSQPEISELISKPYGQNPLLSNVELKFINFGQESGCIK